MQFRSLPGHVPYDEARALQLELVDARARGEIEDTILFLEHEPVVTRGRGLQWTGEQRPRAMPLGPLPAGIAFAECERGGDLTFHGPGQLVIYPIIKLGASPLSPTRDVAAFIRVFEQVIIDALGDLGVSAGRRENATGVWVGQRKIASLGLAVRKWVTWHGAALNAVNDLTPFRLISPCGFDPEVMTRLEDVAAFEHDGWRKRLESVIQRRLVIVS